MPDQVDWRALEREASPGRAVGRLLRDQREARGLDLAAVEKSLKIRRTNLEAIEEGSADAAKVVDGDVHSGAWGNGMVPPVIPKRDRT